MHESHTPGASPDHSRLALKPMTPSPGTSTVDTTAPYAGEEGWTETTKKFLSSPPEAPEKLPFIDTTRVDLAESFRHSGWQATRRRVDAAMSELSQVSARRLSAFRGCGCDARVEWRYMTAMRHSKEYRILSTKCHDRFCIPCANERARRIRNSLMLHIAKKEDLSLITLTLKASSEPLAKILDRITRCFRLLRSKPLWKKAVRGGCAIIETKIGRNSGEWHVHFHVLAEASFLRQDRLAAAWLGITKDSNVVDVRRVGAKSGGVQYVTKYVTKAADHTVTSDPNRLKQAIIAFTGRRLVSTFAAWRGLKLMEKIDEELVSDFPQPWINIGSLHDLLTDARGGSEEAARIVRLLKRAPLRAEQQLRPLPIT